MPSWSSARSTDSVAARFADFWTAKRDDIRTIVGHAEQLASKMEQRHAEFVLCHSDLHARNVLLRGEDELVIIDWDEPILATKERDLMFVGGGVGGIWNDPREADWFYKGYGPAEIDAVALAHWFWGPSEVGAGSQLEVLSKNRFRYPNVGEIEFGTDGNPRMTGNRNAAGVVCTRAGLPTNYGTVGRVRRKVFEQGVGCSLLRDTRRWQPRNPSAEDGTAHSAAVGE